MLPTLAELVASMEASEEAVNNTASSIRDLTDETINFSEEGSEVLTAAELSQARSYANMQDKLAVAAAEAEHAALKIAEAAKKAAEETQREVDRANASWAGFMLKQDEIMHENGRE